MPYRREREHETLIHQSTQFHTVLWNGLRMLKLLYYLTQKCH